MFELESMRFVDLSTGVIVRVILFFGGGGGDKCNLVNTFPLRMNPNPSSELPARRLVKSSVQYCGL